MAVIRAKEIQWTGDLDSEISDRQWGFWILRDDPEDLTEEGKPIIAGWGEGDLNRSFATVDEAKAWCKGLADSFVQQAAEVTQEDFDDD